MPDNTMHKLSAARIPFPVCQYRFEDEKAIVSTVNDAFAAEITDETDGQGVEAMLTEQFSERDLSSDYERVLSTSGQFSVTETSEKRYQVTVIPPGSGDDGFLLFIPVEDTVNNTAERLGVDHVASVVSHDLRNPLDVAKARLRAGRESGNDEHLEHVEQAHERMERIIRDVLTLARGEDVVNPDETVDLTDVTERAWHNVETNGATLDVAEQLPTTVADADRISRLFENLFRNSVEHGSAKEDAENGISITVGQLDDAKTAGFYVADDGPGIPPSEREKVFEPGYTTDDHGTGLGLAIVSRIVDIHGWRVDVAGSESGGARFEITGIKTDESDQ